MYKVYCGKVDKKMDDTVVSLCDNLLRKAGLTEAQGRTFYTDNYYTSMSLVKHLYNKYRWTCVGTIVPTEKNEWASNDLPFHKLSNGARTMIERGWYHEAAIKLRAENSRHEYYIQCSTWKDKKQVMFLSNNKVGHSVGLTVSRRVRGKKCPDTIPGPRAQADYVQNFNAIDRNDQDSVDHSTTICTNGYYIRIFCWALDRVIHAAYVIGCSLSQAGMGQPRLKQYRSKNFGHHNFQINLAMDLMNYGIGLEWDGNLNNSDRPSFMPKGALVPCDRGRCFFCVKGLTTRITHWQSKKARVTVEYKCGARVMFRKCTSKRVDLGLKSGRYCRMCYRKQVTTELKAQEKVKRCRTSQLGCPICTEPICEECWKDGYDRHA